MPPSLAPSKKVGFNDDGLFSFDEVHLEPLLTIADALQIAVSASTSPTISLANLLPNTSFPASGNSPFAYLD